MNPTLTLDGSQETWWMALVLNSVFFRHGMAVQRLRSSLQIFREKEPPRFLYFSHLDFFCFRTSADEVLSVGDTNCSGANWSRSVSQTMFSATCFMQQAKPNK